MHVPSVQDVATLSRSVSIEFGLALFLMIGVVPAASLGWEGLSYLRLPTYVVGAESKGRRMFAAHRPARFFGDDARLGHSSNDAQLFDYFQGFRRRFLQSHALRFHKSMAL